MWVLLKRGRGGGYSNYAFWLSPDVQERPEFSGVGNEPGGSTGMGDSIEAGQDHENVGEH